MKHLGSLVPEQFVNHKGDQHLCELCSQFNAAAFEVSSQVANNGDAHNDDLGVNWKGKLLTANIDKLTKHVKKKEGICLDVAVPSCRVNNDNFLQ